MSEDLQHIERIAGLIIKYHREKLNDREYRELMDWCDLSEANRRLFERLSDPNYVRDKLKELPNRQALKEAAWAKLITVISAEDENPYTAVIPMRRTSWPRYMVAASLAGTLAVGCWLYIKYSSIAKIHTPSTLASNDVAPGGNKATLTLSNGQQIVLDDAKSGMLTEQDHAQVVKKDAGTLSYTSTLLHEKPKKEELSYNTLSTPRSGTFLVELPDHSKVWLNNESSLRYPTYFDGQDSRTVELTGEAFFDIKKDPIHPFKVKIGSKIIEVLGTSFNIQAYSDEQSMQTTLISGSVKVIAGEQTSVLVPGQQAGISNNADANDIRVTTAENLRQIIAWKDGLFFFHDSNIETVMRQLARWYDVEIIYEGKKTTNLFSGMIRRDNRASDVLKVLALSDVHFRIEEKKIIVMP
ncbi:MAG TPA: FecR domain-containing protein [Puia sp.]|nr:FecR domain-containing protein [Puia sp.]